MGVELVADVGGRRIRDGSQAGPGELAGKLGDAGDENPR